MTKAFIVFLLLAAPLVSQTTVNMPNSVAVSATASDALNRWIPTQLTATTTTLAAGYTAGGTAMTFGTGVGFGVNDLVLIDTEVFLITAKTGASMTVTGAQLGTSSANHSSGSTVTLLRYRSFRQFFLTVINDAVARIMEQTGSAFDSYQTAVTNAKNSLETQKTTAVQ